VPRYERVSVFEDDARRSMLMARVSEALYARVGAHLEQEPFFSYEGVAVVASDCWFNTSAIRRDLGWKPPVPPDEAAARTAAWFTTHPIPRPLVAWRGLFRR
jgi:nucleoside-diphosphate-sugar epimerase